jgi:hypothetical protein
MAWVFCLFVLIWNLQSFSKNGDFMFDFKVRRNSQGFGLVEALVAVGIVSMIGLAMMTLVSNQAALLRFLEQKGETLEFKSLIALSFQDADLCTCQIDPDVTLSGPSANATLVPCSDGAMDQVGTDVLNITTTGFRGRSWFSPLSLGSCGPIVWNSTAPNAFDWIAIGR